MVISNITPLELQAQKTGLLWLIRHGRCPEAEDLVQLLEMPLAEIPSLYCTTICYASGRANGTGRCTAVGQTHCSPDHKPPGNQPWPGPERHGFGLFLCREVKRRTSAACWCGEPKETAEHVLTTCRWHAALRPTPPLDVGNSVHRKYIGDVVRRPSPPLRGNTASTLLSPEDSRIQKLGGTAEGGPCRSL